MKSLPVAIASVVLVACGSSSTSSPATDAGPIGPASEKTCKPGEGCTCDGNDACRVLCDGIGCSVDCKGNGACVVRCPGGRCNIACQGAGACSFEECNDSCSCTAFGTGACQ